MTTNMEMELDLENIILIISDDASKMHSLSNIIDDIEYEDVKKDLIKAKNKIMQYIETYLKEIQQMYLNSTEEDKEKIISDLTSLSSNNYLIKPYINVVMNRLNLKYL